MTDERSDTQPQNLALELEALRKADHAREALLQVIFEVAGVPLAVWDEAACTASIRLLRE